MFTSDAHLIYSSIYNFVFVIFNMFFTPDIDFYNILFAQTKALILCLENSAQSSCNYSRLFEDII